MHPIRSSTTRFSHPYQNTWQKTKSKQRNLYIADSAMVTKKNLEKTGNGIQFISRLPSNYNECSDLIKDAINKDDWVELGKLSGTIETSCFVLLCNVPVNGDSGMQKKTTSIFRGDS